MTIALRDRIDRLNEAQSCVDIVQRHSGVQLRKHSGAELCGPCPKCGGDDRFYVAPDYAACRQCHTSRMDAVGLVAWLHNVSQGQAADMLAGGASWQPVNCSATTVAKSVEVSTDFATYAAPKVRNAQDLLRLPDGAQARDYLWTRGLTQETWRKFEIGYTPQRRLPSDRQKSWPALTWPAYSHDTHELVAVRYRFIGETPTGDRYDSLKGSSMRGRLFGVQALPPYVLMPPDEGRKSAESVSCLVLIEGELNACSVWQVAHSAGVDVLSTGSQSVRSLPAWAVELASRYGVVLTWFDEPDIAANIAQQLPDAVAVRSPVIDGKAQDANDVLQRHLLGGMVQKLRLSALKDATQREGVLWDMWDSPSIDASTRQVMQQLAQELGRSL